MMDFEEAHKYLDNEKEMLRAIKNITEYDAVKDDYGVVAKLTINRYGPAILLALKEFLK